MSSPSKRRLTRFKYNITIKKIIIIAKYNQFNRYFFAAATNGKLKKTTSFAETAGNHTNILDPDGSNEFILFTR
jgi:predicted glycosyltransferase involved in capsule biosynthesis